MDGTLRLSLDEVSSVFQTFMHQQLGPDFHVVMEYRFINFRNLKWISGFPDSAMCFQLSISEKSKIRELYTNTTKILMHGFVHPNNPSPSFLPSIYFMNSKNERTVPYIRAATTAQLLTGLRNSVKTVLDDDAVLEVFKNFVAVSCSSGVAVSSTRRFVDFADMGLQEAGLFKYNCHVVSISALGLIQWMGEYARTTYVVMHGLLESSTSSVSAGIYFVDKDYVSVGIPIRGRTVGELEVGLGRVLMCTSGTGPSNQKQTVARTDVQGGPPNQGQDVVQVLQRILEVCESLNRKIRP
jgi:hypothetical protein